MNIKFPWLISRRKIITSCLAEIFFIIILNKYFLSDYLLFSSNIDLFTIIFTPFWLIFSYVFGRYSFEEKFFRNKKFILFLKLFFRTFIISNLGICFVFVLSININLNNYNHFDQMIFLYSTYLSFFINILQIPTNLYFIKNANKEEEWIFVGPIDVYNFLIQELKWSRRKIKITLKSNEFKFKSTKNITGILFHEIDNEKLNKLFEFKKVGLKIYSSEKWCEYYLQKLPSEILTPQFLINIDNKIFDNSMQFRIKRIGDIFFSIFLFALSIPILIISCVLIFLEDGKACIYKQERIGKNQKSFMIYKLRTMKVNAEKDQPQWASKTDDRITGIGKFLRKSRLDELPQLFNVFIGDMSLIGPRPEREIFDSKLMKFIPKYKYRYFIKPGLSGWAQVNFPYGSSIEDSKNKFSYDIYYLRNFSIWLDFLILLKTIRIVILKRGSDPIR